MSNIEENDDDDTNVILIGKTIRDNEDNSTALIIPKEFTRALDIENSKVSISLLDDFHGNRHLIVTKYNKEIVIEWITMVTLILALQYEIPHYSH